MMAMRGIPPGTGGARSARARRSRPAWAPRLAWLLGVLIALPLAARHGAPAGAEDPSGFTNFETEPVRPLALSPEGDRLFALNSADDRVEVFAVEVAGLRRLGELAVGLRPVALAARSRDEVWVVNHLSDSVSVLDLSDPAAGRVVRTLPVGDEPRDIVVAGRDRERVFVASARRADPTTPGLGRGSVWVFEAAAPEQAPTEIVLLGMPPRGLAASPDGRGVYAAIFHSGNGSTVVDELAVEAGGGPPAPQPPNASGVAPPRTGLIVGWDDGAWRDEAGRDWSAAIPFRLPDHDVFVIDAAAATPRWVDRFQGVGTVLFNLAVQPGTGEIWVTNTEARNRLRFEPNLRGRAVESRVTRILRPQAGEDAARPVPLNPHIDPSVSPGPAEEIARSLGQPTDLVFRSDGRRAYVAAFGSRQVGVLDEEARVLDRIPVGFGPAGLALDERHARLFVLNHLDATISVVALDPATGGGRVVETLPLRFDPSPPEIHAGRPFFYDMALGSGHGDMACASCHVFGDRDGLAWDLGDPTGSLLRMPFALSHDIFILKPRDFRFHPMKGPMSTQSFRGMAEAGPMHWRGDRFGPGEDPGDELESFHRFADAFVTLNGRDEPPSRAEMEAFARFVFTIRYPPNPIQSLDRSLTPDQQAGLDFFRGAHLVDSGVTNCEGCHSLPLGTNKRINFEGLRTGQDFKAPHLRNLYQKVGRFDEPGQQVSGFGFLHDGSMDRLSRFLESDVFDFPGEDERARAQVRRQVEAYLLAFDTGMAPAVGQMLTLGAAATWPERQRLDLLANRARAGDCDLIARGLSGGEARGWLLAGDGFLADRAAEAPLPLEALLDLAAQAAGELTFTCVPPGDGRRSALDRDRDGALDGDERRAGTDPADPASYPGAASPTPRPVATTPDPPPPSPTPSASATASTAAPPTASPTHAAGPGSIYLPLLDSGTEPILDPRSITTRLSGGADSG